MNLQDATQLKTTPILLQIRSKSRPIVTAGYLCNLMMEATISSSTATGVATVRDSAMGQGTSGSATDTFIRWLNVSTKLYSQSLR